MTGWQLVDNKWYYFNPVSDGTKGIMRVNAWIDGYYVGADGSWDPQAQAANQWYEIQWHISYKIE